MKRKIRLCLETQILCTDEQALKRLLSLLSKLTERGFLDNGTIVFEESDEQEVSQIIDDCYGTELQKQ